jgi:hypothetical protein
MAFWQKENPLVRDLQAAFRGVRQINSEKCIDELCRIIDGNLWSGCESREGVPFESFVHWVVSPQPEGLGIADQKSAEFLRTLLLSAGRIAIWAKTLERICNRPGRPQMLAHSDGLRTFYHVSTSSTSTDRMLLRLLRHRADLFAKVANGILSLGEATKAAGWGRRPSGARISIAVLGQAFALLDDAAQWELLDLLWGIASANTRTRFVAARNI